MELSDKIIASLKRVVKKLEEGTEDELSFKFNYESSEYTIFQLPGARENMSLKFLQDVVMENGKL